MGCSVTLTPPRHGRPSLGARLAASLRRSLVSQQTAAAAVAGADNDDLSKGARPTDLHSLSFLGRMVLSCHEVPFPLKSWHAPLHGSGLEPYT